MINSDLSSDTHPSTHGRQAWEWFVQMGCLEPYHLPQIQVPKKGEGGPLLLGVCSFQQQEFELFLSSGEERSPFSALLRCGEIWHR